MRTKKTVALVSGLALTGTLMFSGCGTDLYSMPLPGGADVGSDPVRITADFSDVLDLVPQSAVKVENIAVGRVESIKLNEDGRSARATILIRGDVDLPEGTAARLQQTSLLGEKYVALVRPEEGEAGSGSLRSGANIPIRETSQVAEVEQVLGALSMVINGGGVAKFQEISRELQKVSTGRPEEIRGFLRNVGTFVAGLDARKGAVTDALDAMAGLSTTLNQDKEKIAQALEGLSPGMQVLVDQRKELVSMLTALDKLSTVSVRTLDASQEDMIEDMKLLEPILRELAESGNALPDSLELLLTYPFPDEVLNAIRGDYFNVFATANYTSLPASCTGLGCPWPQMPDTGTMPPFDWEAELDSAGRMAMPGLVAPAPSSPPAASDQPSPSGSASPSGPASPSGSATPAGPGPSPSSSASPTDGPTSTPSVTPSPSLLPPTDSAAPGLGQRSVQVPTARKAR
ncbi:MCE family protein [Nocardioides marmoriginsengisoli]|uniref:MCE family protein n=1 Tax=Nocardioides marmoriginsengisoli TaxID=661483 RepID=A0A3N0CHC1_9ACTN|nr:MCE family protein [Nocardioides marmoriginsengisoli]RNL62426.1 MCE family protein [Nocardioides marmoriginsengisoli]